MLIISIQLFHVCYINPLEMTTELFVCSIHVELSLNLEMSIYTLTQLVSTDNNKYLFLLHSGFK